MIETPQRLAAYDLEALTVWLRGRLHEGRLQHSLGALQKASELARKFDFSPEAAEKAAVAALLHDCAKLMTPEALLEACTLFEIPLDDGERQALQTLHPFVGAEIVRYELGITDSDILNAIRYHTTGRAGMSPVEKVVYLADKIEENTRNPLYTQKIQAVLNFQVKTSLEKAVLFILDSTMTFLIEKGQIIHPRTLEARNDLIAFLKSSDVTGLGGA